MSSEYTKEFIDSIIRMAWADEISFEQINRDRGINEKEVIKIMRSNLKPNSFKLWRKRVTGRASKHEKRTKFLAKIMD